MSDPGEAVQRRRYGVPHTVGRIRWLELRQGDRQLLLVLKDVLHVLQVFIIVLRRNLQTLHLIILSCLTRSPAALCQAVTCLSPGVLLLLNVSVLEPVIVQTLRKSDHVLLLASPLLVYHQTCA